MIGRQSVKKFRLKHSLFVVFLLPLFTLPIGSVAQSPTSFSLSASNPEIVIFESDAAKSVSVSLIVDSLNTEKFIWTCVFDNKDPSTESITEPGTVNFDAVGLLKLVLKFSSEADAQDTAEGTYLVTQMAESESDNLYFSTLGMFLLVLGFSIIRIRRRS